MQLAFLILLAVAGALFWTGCASETAPVYTKGGRQYGAVEGSFRHRWWNYYERGLSYAEGRYFTEALADLTEALRLRAGDQRMARTYGMHFVDYFPSREIGIVYFQQGDLVRARDFLERSIEEFPSAKARFYLDRVRKKRILDGGKAVAPPALSVDAAAEEIWTRDDPLVISGTVKDPNFVSSVKVGGVPVFLEAAAERVDFTRPLSLAEGKHGVSVVAKNLAGKQSEKRLVVHVDRSGPLLTVDAVWRVQSIDGDRVFFSGAAFDDSGVVRIESGSGDLPVQEGRAVEFSGTAGASGGSVRLVAFDRLGNTTEAVIAVDNPIGGSSAASANVSSRLVASRSTSLDTGLLAKTTAAKDRGAPSIRLKDWEASQTVYLDKIFLEGEVKDDTKVVRLFVNDEPVLRRESPNVFFNCAVDLKEGKNHLQIEAVDDTGNSASTSIEVVREIPRALQLAERLSMTVMPFEQKGELSAMAEGFQDQLVDALFERNRFRLVERDRLDLVLQEQKLSQSDLIDKETAVRLGRLIAASTVVTGSIIQTRNGTEIVTRVLDTETSEIVATEDVYDEVHSLTDAARLAEGLALKLHREFPLLTGYVIQPEGTAFYTDLGKPRVKLQRRLIVYREKELKHPVSGKVLGARTEILGRAVVTEVQPEMSKAECVDSLKEPIRQLDRVITE